MENRCVRQSCIPSGRGDRCRSDAGESSDILELTVGTVPECRSVPQFSHGLPVGRVYSFRDVTRQAETQAHLRLAARVFESESRRHFHRRQPAPYPAHEPWLPEADSASATELHVGQPAVVAL